MSGDPVAQALSARALLERNPLCSRNYIQRVLKETPSGRPRLSGPVGPETDYSVRLSRIPNDEYGRRGENNGFATRGILQMTNHPIYKDRCPIREKVAIHHMIEFLYLSDYACKCWTEYAMKHGIHYDGEYRYRFPSKKSKDKLAKVAFDHFKSHGLVPCAKRTPESAMRRRAARTERQRLSRLRNSPPLEVKEVFVTRSSISAKALRSKWWRTHHVHGATWSSYRSTCVVDKVVTLWPPGHRTAVSSIVVDAVNKIYSRTVVNDSFDYESIAPKQKPGKLFKWRVKEPEVPKGVPGRDIQAGKAKVLFVENNVTYQKVIGGQTSVLKHPP